MPRILKWTLPVLLAAAAGVAALAPPAPLVLTEADALTEVEAVIAEYSTSYTAWRAKLATAEGEAEKEIKKQRPIAARSASQLWKLIENEQESEAAARAMSWMLSQSTGKKNQDRAREGLFPTHLASPWMADVVGGFARDLEGGEAQIDRVISATPHERVRALCQLAKARHYLRWVKTGKRVQAADEKLLEAYGRSYSKQMLERLLSADIEALGGQAEAVLDHILARYSDVKSTDPRTLGELAEGLLFARRRLSIGAPAPDIEGTDVFGERFRLSDYRGKVVLLDFWGDW